MPDPNRPISRLPRAMSRLGRTPVQRVSLLVVGSILAFAIGRWTAGEAARTPPARPSEIPASVSGRPRVIDGDTIDIAGVRVRLFGIDAPEREQLCERGDGSRYACGLQATEALVAAISNLALSCTRRDIDPYGRMVAICLGSGGDVSAMLVEQGYAMAYRHYSHDYVDEEDRAHRARLGIWQGRFEAPWDYRHHGQGRKVR